MLHVSPSYRMDHFTRSAVEPSSGFSLAIRLYCDYEQVVDFRMPGVAVLGLDERPPLGHGWGPSPAQLFGAALGACLGGALLRGLRDAKVDVVDLYTEVRGVFRNEPIDGPHLTSLEVRLTPVLEKAEDIPALPTSDQVVASSLVADSLRSDIALLVVITPEIRGDGRPPACELVRLVKNAPLATP